MKKVAVIPNISCFDFIRKQFSECDYEVENFGGKEFPTIINELKDVEVLIVALEKVSFEVIGKMSALRVIGRLGVGLDNIDVREATRRNVAVINIPDYCVEEVALQACSAILAANRKTIQSNTLVKDNKWEQWQELVPIIPLSESTLGIIGIGRIGEKVISLMHSFGCKILAYDPYCRNKSVPKGVELTSFEDVLKKSDIITIHCPLNAETHNLINKDNIKSMIRKPVIINVSRGGIVNEKDLIEALDHNEISFAFLDALEQEPPEENNPLVNHVKAFVTNHIGWYSEKTIDKPAKMLVERIINYLNGKEVVSLVNREGLNNKNGVE